MQKSDFFLQLSIVSSPRGIKGGMIFVSSTRQGEQLLNFKSQSGDTFRGGEMILGSQAGGDCFIMTNCWYFHKMPHPEFYKFRLRRYLIFFRALLGVIALKSLT